MNRVTNSKILGSLIVLLTSCYSLLQAEIKDSSEVTMDRGVNNAGSNNLHTVQNFDYNTSEPKQDEVTSSRDSNHRDNSDNPVDK